MPTLTSLVKLPSHLRATCTYCHSNRVTTLSMTLADGSPVEFTSCHRCEGKLWRHDQGDGQSGGRGGLALSDVLDRARKQA